VSFVLLILLGLLVWAVFSFALTAMLFGLPRYWPRRDPAAEVRAARRRPPSDRTDEIRVSRTDRRRAERRIGMPDPRELQIDRRGGSDRRRGQAMA
jgi:hypothetical protein